MNAATEAGIVALLQADRSVPADRIPIILEVAKGRLPEPPKEFHNDEFLTTKEACELLKCSRMTLHRMETDSQLESIQLRGKKLFERVKLINALKRGKEMS